MVSEHSSDNHFTHDTLHEQYPDQCLDLFVIKLDNFFAGYYKAVTPYSLHQDLYPNSPTPLSTLIFCHSSFED